MSNKRVLIVDDEPQITKILKSTFAAHEFDVQVAEDADSAFDEFEKFDPNIIITDLQMPGVGGLALCREVRGKSDVPIIVLSVKEDEETKVRALDAGADDYIMKPFGMDELMARVRAALRRSTHIRENEDVTRWRTGDFAVDLESHSVLFREQKVHLTPKEFELLIFLIRNEDKVLTHRTILATVWGGNAVNQTEYLRVFIGNLRKKFENDPSKPRYILTEPWVGYRFTSGSRENPK